MAVDNTADLATPDFYDYSWSPLQSATTDDDFVVMRWSDGLELRSYSSWLRENAVCEGAIDPSTREGTLDPAYLPLIRAMEVDLTESGALHVVWEFDGMEASYHPGWLRHIAEGHNRAQSFLPDPIVWTAEQLPEPPTHDGRLVLEDDRILRDWIDDLLRYGIARLRDLPIDPDIGLQIAQRIGPIRATNFGTIWDVKVDVPLDGASDTNSTANTNLRLVPHTDLPTRETPPGYQFLYCLANETQGGESTMADGAAIVEYLRNNHPGDYDALTTLRWVFFNRGRGIDHRWSGPIIDLGVPGSPLTLRAFHPVRAFPDMDDADVPRAYDALTRFSSVAADDSFQMRYPFRPGDLVAFDNRRILHGRDSYSAGGKRHLRGLYIDHDEVRSYARAANREDNMTRQGNRIGEEHA